jgi:hypothetical protein
MEKTESKLMGYYVLGKAYYVTYNLGKYRKVKYFKGWYNIPADIKKYGRYKFTKNRDKASIFKEEVGVAFPTGNSDMEALIEKLNLIKIIVKVEEEKPRAVYGY